MSRKKYWVVHRLPGGLNKRYHAYKGQVAEEVSVNGGMEAVCLKFRDGKQIWFALTQAKRVTYCFKGRSLTCLGSDQQVSV